MEGEVKARYCTCYPVSALSVLDDMNKFEVFGILMAVMVRRIYVTHHIYLF